MPGRSQISTHGSNGHDSLVGGLGAVVFVLCAIAAMTAGSQLPWLDGPQILVLVGLAAAGAVVISTLLLAGRFIAQPSKFWSCVALGGVLSGTAVSLAHGVLMSGGILTTN